MSLEFLFDNLRYFQVTTAHFRRLTTPNSHVQSASTARQTPASGTNTRAQPALTTPSQLDLWNHSALTALEGNTVDKPDYQQPAGNAPADITAVENHRRLLRPTDQVTVGSVNRVPTAPRAPQRRFRVLRAITAE